MAYLRLIVPDEESVRFWYDLVAAMDSEWLLWARESSDKRSTKSENVESRKEKEPRRHAHDFRRD